jgi:SAM-dependent methyltransferase
MGVPAPSNNGGRQCFSASHVGVPEHLSRTYGREVPDPIFDDPRLAMLYDTFDGSRNDLDHYLSIARELKADSILDVGCGTGSFALRAASQGMHVTGVDPASASLDLARKKAGADKVAWILGDATALPPMQVDLAVMTGNVAQVFLTNEAWKDTLVGIRDALAPAGHLVFETRDPARKQWDEWSADQTSTPRQIDGVGIVHHRMRVTDVALPFVSFQHIYAFPDGTEIPSDSTLRFRDAAEVAADLQTAGYNLIDIRDAPDRPGAEHVYVAQRTTR